ncbi:hypothetical protein [Amycolatopsis sp. NPDC051716]|uniref:hypothetical protein n=1 Tax=Amycolatopsis sp. NPDC051716 TaxID=3155804 RepID=UPI00344AD8D5
MKLAEAAAERQEIRAAESEARASRAEIREREQYAAAEERFLKSQLDSRAPAAFIKVEPGYNRGFSILDGAPARRRSVPDLVALPASELHNLRNIDTDFMSYGFNRAIHDNNAIEIASGEEYAFVVTVTLELVNVSRYPARIDMFNAAGFEVIGDFPGNFAIVPPETTRFALARRYIHTGELRAVNGSGYVEYENSMPRMEFWVRDLGMNILDKHVLTLDLRFFRMDGSRIIVDKMPAYSWSEYAEQVPPRIYERIDTAKEAALREARDTATGKG